MHLMEFLDRSGVKYDVRQHPPVFTSQGLAQREHEHGKLFPDCELGAAANRDEGVRTRRIA